MEEPYRPKKEFVYILCALPKPSFLCAGPQPSAVRFGGGFLVVMFWWWLVVCVVSAVVM